MLMRLISLQGDGRFQKCWREVQIDRLAVLKRRPPFLSPGGLPTEHSPATAFAAFECSLRPEPLPESGYSEFCNTLTMSFVDW
jgi:hypothetical protein